MSVRNRTYIAKHDLFDKVVSAASSSESLDHTINGINILENLFKESESTCHRVISCGGLHAMVQACRSDSIDVLLHCAAGLANCAMYGGAKCQQIMIQVNAHHWLFPLAFSTDSGVRYYAILAICFLAANKDLSALVARSGTLDSVVPFLQTHDPETFCPSHAHGRSASWLRALVPLLTCNSDEAQSVAAFYFAREVGIRRRKKKQRFQVFHDIEAIAPLTFVAKNGPYLASTFACQTLHIIGAPLPQYLCWDVLNWSPDHVSAWAADLGLDSDTASAFRENRVTGKVLVKATLEDLMDTRGVDLKSRLKGKWLLRQIQGLRCRADPVPRDAESICRWLVQHDQHLALYKVDFFMEDITPGMVPYLTDDNLAELGVSKKLDRARIMMLAKCSSEYLEQGCLEHSMPSQVPPNGRKYDVFISYRRATGSQLASLLKIHLQLRGLTVFLDVTELGNGEFDTKICINIANSSNFVLVLTPNCLDRCQGDTIAQDWLHKEIQCAFENDIPVVPVTSNFEWPNDASLFSDEIQKVMKINAINWIHEYQDACVSKLANFLHLPRLHLKQTLPSREH